MVISQTDYCERCELFNGDIVRGVCAYCRDAEFLAERGQLFRAGGDGEPAFVGHDTGATWNGFAVPAFEFDEALAVLRYLESVGEAQRVHVTNSDALTFTFDDLNTGETVDVLPNDDGRYVFDGWCWDRLDIVGDEYANRAFDAVEARFSAPIPFEKLRTRFDAFRDELLDAWALEARFIGEDKARETWPCVNWYLTRY